MIVTMKPNTDIQYGCDIQSCGRHGFFLTYMRFSPGCPEWSQAPEYHYLDLLATYHTHYYYSFYKIVFYFCNCK